MTYAISANVKTLLTMLTYRRPAGSKAESDFVNRFIAPLGTTPDNYGNHWLTIGDSPILWSSHTDTVHKYSGTQQVYYGADIATSKGGGVLGADCAAGVWLMAQMIKAEIPGTYVFHRAEEIGGLGSAWVARNTPERLANIKFAIAFDRYGYHDIITHQYGGRTASNAFAASLANALHPMRFVPCDNGIFTDTANYSGLIPECTNISVGYFDHHTSKERLHVDFLCKLLETILFADFSQLACERDHRELSDTLDSFYGAYDSPIVASAALESYVYENPSIVADYLAECGHDLNDLRAYARRRN